MDRCETAGRSTNEPGYVDVLLAGEEQVVLKTTTGIEMRQKWEKILDKNFDLCIIDLTTMDRGRHVHRSLA